MEFVFKTYPKKNFFFDLDGTLFDTNRANFLAYQEAIHSIIGNNKEIIYNYNKRFTRNSLIEFIPNLSSNDIKKIISLKEVVYVNYLNEIKINKNLEFIIKKYYRENNFFLVTKCNIDRALLILNYFNIIDFFYNKFFYKICNNKYEETIKALDLNPINIIIFENEDNEINDAIKSGILIDNIIKV